MTRTDHALTATGALASAAFAGLARRNAKPKSFLHDLRLRRRIPARGRKTSRTAYYIGFLGKEYSVIPAAAALALYLLQKERRAGAAAVMSATTIGTAASHVFDAILPQKTPPPGRRAPFDPHFPSGHALHSASFLAIAAWVLGREGVANRKVMMAGAGALAASLGIDRLIQDRHWTSDVVGGWLAAIGIASFTAAAYEHLRRADESGDVIRGRVERADKAAL
jgi:membrane-associated phospholipid phosphatase